MKIVNYDSSTNTAYVGRRTNEIGIRMALGAQQTDALWMVLRETPVTAAIGIPAALASTRLISSQGFGLTAFRIHNSSVIRLTRTIAGVYTLLVKGR